MPGPDRGVSIAGCAHAGLLPPRDTACRRRSIPLAQAVRLLDGISRRQAPARPYATFGNLARFGRTGGDRTMTGAPGAPGPVRVVRVDVDQPVPDVSATRAAGGRYRGAFVIVERSGRPLGNFEVDLDDAGIPAAELKNLIEEHIGDAWSGPGPDRPVVDESRLPLISVVIPTAFQRVQLLTRCVAAVCAQAYPSFEGIVSDNRPDDGPERAAHWRRLMADPRVTVVAEPLTGSPPARNPGVQGARGEGGAFLGGDAVTVAGG